MKSSKKIIITICLIIISIVLGAVLYLYTLTNKSQDYICEKYGVDEEQIELVKFNLPEYWVSDNPLPNIQTDHLNWIYKYKDNEFTVKYYDNNFCDDFQLEEVRKLCTEYFRENISENIVDFRVESYDLYTYQHALYVKNYSLKDTVITKDNVLDYITRDCVGHVIKWIFLNPLGDLNAEKAERERIEKIISKTIPNYNDDYGILFESSADYYKERKFNEK